MTKEARKTKMVSLKLTSLSFVLLIVLVNVRNSRAQTHLVREKRAAPQDGQLEVAGKTSVKAGKEIYEAAVESSRKLRGRQTMPKSVSREELMVKDETFSREETKISGATYSVANCSHGLKPVLNVKRKLSNRSRPLVKVKIEGFMAFSADYHVPKSHPPKNN